MQLLIQTGFAFPWTGDLQVQSYGVFAALAALRPSTVSIARTGTQVWIRADEWFVAATIIQGRYHDIDGLLRRLPEPTSQLILGEPDAARVMKELRRSGQSADEEPITIDLKRPAIRIPGGAEWPLAATQRSGHGSSVVCGRMLLLTALDLGFRRLAVSGGSQPVVFRDASRTHVFQPIAGGREVSPPRPAPRTPAIPKTGETRERSRPAAVRPPRVRRAVTPLAPPPPPGRWKRLWRSVRRLVRIRH